MNKKIVLALFLFANLIAFSQKPCEIESNVTDSLGTYKLTKQAIIFERSFAGNSTTIFFALFNTESSSFCSAQFALCDGFFSIILASVE